jgi:hypothetical protein
MSYLLLLIGLISGAIIAFFLTQRAQKQKTEEDSKTIEGLKIEVATMSNSSQRLSEDLSGNSDRTSNRVEKRN